MKERVFAYHGETFVHILWHPDLKFNPRLVKMINEEQDYFDKKDHIFITPHRNVYEALSNYPNIYYVQCSDKELLRRYGKYGKWIFLHSMRCPKIDFILLPDRIVRKIIWRTWGHDIRFGISTGGSFKNRAKNIGKRMYLNKIKKIRYIAVANMVDEVNVENAFGKVPTTKFAYGNYSDEIDELSEIAEKGLGKNHTDVVRILVGHSGIMIDRHKEALDRLKIYAQENIMICLVLSYGREEYINETCEYAREIFGEKVEIIRDFMPYGEYCKYLNSIDIAVLYAKYSSALGNMGILSTLHKPIFISRESNFAEAFIRQGIQPKYLEDLEDMSFEEFKDSNADDVMVKIYGQRKTKEGVCEMDSKLINELKNES